MNCGAKHWPVGSICSWPSLPLHQQEKKLPRLLCPPSLLFPELELVLVTPAACPGAIIGVYMGSVSWSIIWRPEEFSSFSATLPFWASEESDRSLEMKVRLAGGFLQLILITSSHLTSISAQTAYSSSFATRWQKLWSWVSVGGEDEFFLLTEFIIF